MKNVIIWTIALFVAWLSASNSFSGVAKDKAPELALTSWPVNGFAQENSVARAIFASWQDNKDILPNDIKRAQTAFIKEPTAAKAISVLALGSNTENRRELMTRALSVSRRELFTLAWLIEDGQNSNDIEILLSYYDISMRVYPQTKPTLLPRLASAVQLEAFLPYMSTLLKDGKPWAYSFWQEIIRTPHALQNATILRMELGSDIPNHAASHDADLIESLVRNNQYQTANKLYLFLLGKSAQNILIRNPEFKENSKYPPLDWQIFSNGEYGAVIVDGGLSISALGGSGGMVARQLVRLPAGLFKIDVAAGDYSTDQGLLTLSLNCADKNSDQQVQLRLPIKQDNISVQVRNPSTSCEYFWLTLTGSANEGITGFDAVVESIDIVKLES